MGPGNRHWSTDCYALLFNFSLLLFSSRKARSLSAASSRRTHLLIVKRYRKAAQPINADASLLAHLEFQAALLLRADLLFEFGDASHQFLFAWFCHTDSPRQNLLDGV